MNIWIECEVSLLNDAKGIGYVRKVHDGYEWRREDGDPTHVSEAFDLPSWAYGTILKLQQVQVSCSHGIDTEAMRGQGLIVEGGHFKCSIGCQNQVTEGYSQVFAVVDHPLYGKMAVTVKEFKMLGLPEINGFPKK